MEKINIEQDFGEFKKNYERNKTQIISVKLINQKETITSAYLKVAENSKNSFFTVGLRSGRVPAQRHSDREIGRLRSAAQQSTLLVAGSVLV